MAAMAAAMANNMIQLKYGRGDETQSDHTGIEYMSKAGYDPREMLGVMQILKEASGSRGGPAFMQSHPLPEDRLQDIDAVVKKNFTADQLAKLSRGREINASSLRSTGTRERW
jgi:predicted Zn-dependent protease